MDEVRLRNVAFPERGSYSAKLEFSTDNKAGSAQVTIVVELWTKSDADVNSNSYTRAIDDADAVREGRRKLHDFAIRLAEQTKDWAAP